MSPTRMSAGARVVGAAVLLAVLTGGCGVSSAAPRAPLAQRLSEHVTAWQDRGDVPGVSVAVVADGGKPWRSSTGVRPGAQFRVASVTKLFTATVVMLLVEEGLLSLDTPVGAHAPSYEPAAGVTVRQLLNHTSGLPDYGTPELTEALVHDRTRRWDGPRVLATVAGLRPSFAPGSRWEYSNTNYLILAEVIRGVTGRSWAVELRERVLDPLELHDTYVAGFEPGRGSGLVASAYFDLDNDGELEDVEHGPWPALETSESAAGALVSTAEDVARFTHALFSGKVVEPATLQAMVAGGVTGRRYDDYGLGVELRRPDLVTHVLGHGGFLPGYRSATWYVPSTETTITVLANHSEANPADLAELLLHELSG